MKTNSESKLALFGGPAVRKKVFASRPHITADEKKAVLNCLKNLEFSRFIGSPTPNVRKELRMKSRDIGKLKDFWSYMGGPNIRKFEAMWADTHGVPYAISVNSATAGLTTALLAAGIQPGDEVITTPLSFTATATSIVMAQAVPVFADVNIETYCLDPESVREKISKRTRAIVVVHLLGNAGDLDQIQKLANQYKLILIEDSAQAPGSKYKGKTLGSLGDAGVFSFQETKNVMTGEGGMIITKSARIAEKCRMIRNHGESIPNENDSDEFCENIIGHNFRLTEPLAALGWAQVKKLPYLNRIRRENGLYLYRQFEKLEGRPIIPQRLTNEKYFSPYCLGFRWMSKSNGLSRDMVAKALRAEGIPVVTGFPRLMSENIIFTRKMAYGRKQWPFSASPVDYQNGREGLPNATRLQYEEYMGFFQVGWPNTKKDMDDILKAFRKILFNRNALLKNKNKFSTSPHGFISGRR